METVYAALGGVAVVTELAVMTSLRAAESPALSRWLDGGCVLADDALLTAYWSRALGAPDTRGDGPNYLLTGTRPADGVVRWQLDELLDSLVEEDSPAWSNRAHAVFAAFVRWDIAESLDRMSRAPQLPVRSGPPVWGWDGPEDADSLQREEAAHRRFRALTAAVLRPTDPVSTRVEWRTSRDFGERPRMVTERCLVVTADDPEDGSFTWPVDEDGVDQMLNELASWVSTDTAFGWGQERP